MLGSIANWVNRSDLPVDTILEEAQAFIYETLRVREMMMLGSLSFAEGASSAALPDGFLDPILFNPYGGDWPDGLPYVHEAALKAARDSDGNLYEGTPCRWTIIGENAHVDVMCEETFAGEFLYYKTPTSLGPSNLTNFVTRRYPTMLRVACMTKAFEHMKDNARAAAYAQLTLSAIGQATVTNDYARRGQSYPA